MLCVAQKWFRDTFHRSTERVSIVKHWLPRDHVMPQMWIDRVIYDHALSLVRLSLLLLSFWYTHRLD